MTDLNYKSVFTGRELNVRQGLVADDGTLQDVQFQITPGDLAGEFTTGLHISAEDAADLVRQLAPRVGVELKPDLLKVGDFVRVTAECYRTFQAGDVVKVDAGLDSDNEHYVVSLDRSKGTYVNRDHLSNALKGEVVTTTSFVEESA